MWSNSNEVSAELIRQMACATSRSLETRHSHTSLCNQSRIFNTRHVPVGCVSVTRRQFRTCTQIFGEIGVKKILGGDIWPPVGLAKIVFFRKRKPSWHPWGLCARAHQCWWISDEIEFLGGDIWPPVGLANIFFQQTNNITTSLRSMCTFTPILGEIGAIWILGGILAPL